MKSLTFELRCPKCGNELELVAQSRPRGATHKAVLRCITSPGKHCGLRWVLNMEMFLATISDQGEATRCGTRLGYNDHFRRGEEPCRDCQTAVLHAHVDRAKREREQNKAISKKKVRK